MGRIVRTCIYRRLLPQPTVSLAEKVRGRSILGSRAPLNTAINQSGQAHTSPRAELLAIAIAIEQSRWPIHTHSDNLGFVVATEKHLAGEHTNSLKGKFVLWARVNRRLNSNQKHVRITWTKGHATEADINKGNSSMAHRNVG